MPSLPHDEAAAVPIESQADVDVLERQNSMRAMLEAFVHVAVL